jgi:hypothetical protein
LLPAGAVAGWALHPLESAAFSRRTPIADSSQYQTRPSLHLISAAGTAVTIAVAQ